MTTRTKSFRWSFVTLAALVLSAVAACVIWVPVFLHDRSVAAEEKAAEVVSRPTLQTFVEGGDFSYLGEKAKDVLPLLQYDSISLERTPCFGPCPVYVVTFFKDGRATLETSNWQDGSKKYYEGKIWMGSYVRLTQMVDLARSVAHQSEYMGQWTDDYTAIVRASSGDETWTVSDYGRVAPVEIWALEVLLHSFQESSEWVPTSGP